MKKGTVIFVLIAIIIVIGIVLWARASSPKETVSTEPSAESVASSSVEDTTTTMDTQESSSVAEPTVTPSGLSYTVLKEGSGEATKNGDSVTVNYTGMLENGTVFDSNTDPKFRHVEPFEFNLGAGMVIKGWDEGVLGMKVGEKRRLVIPANLAYGAQSPSPLIPANSVLVFDVQVMAIN